MADCFLHLSSSHDLLDSFLLIHQEVKTLILSSTKTHISKPTVDRYISDYFGRSVKALDVYNSIREGTEQMHQWLKLLDIFSLITYFTPVFNIQTKTHFPNSNQPTSSSSSSPRSAISAAGIFFAADNSTTISIPTFPSFEPNTLKVPIFRLCLTWPVPSPDKGGGGGRQVVDSRHSMITSNPYENESRTKSR
ncbi:hypothetical protein ACFXTH_045975 [Malus domestica]